MPLRRIAYKQICLEGSVRKTYMVFTREISFRDETHPGWNYPCLRWNVFSCLHVFSEMRFYPGMNHPRQSIFTCNQDEISSRNETRPELKKNLFRAKFHLGMKFSFKVSLSWSMKACHSSWNIIMITLLEDEDK